jgi:phosphomannomutase
MKKMRLELQIIMGEVNFSDSIFKSFEIRGLFPDNFNLDFSFKLGQSLVYLFKIKTIVVGRDKRPSSKKIYDHFIKGLTSVGCNVIDIGQTITPLMYYSVGKLDLDFGVMITASHNTFDYNGFKLVKKKVSFINSNEIKNLKETIRFKKISFSKKKGLVYKKDLTEEYLNHFISFSNFKNIKNIVVENGNGMAGKFLKKLFKKLPLKVTYLNLNTNIKYPKLVNPLDTKTLKILKKEVIKRNADLGIALDYDSDRVGFVDEKGRIIEMDFITAFISKKILEKNKNKKIIYDLRSSKIVKETIIKNKGIPIESVVGHTYISKKMKSIKAFFAGEVSGHYYFSKFYYSESPFFVVIYILNEMDKSKFSKIIAPYRKYYKSKEINFRVNDFSKIMIEIKKRYSKGKISYLDGLKIEFKDWWFNIRESNTESISKCNRCLLRLNLEANKKK